MKTKICQNCNIEFMPPYSSKKYCNQKCYVAKKYPKKIKICQNCKIEFASEEQRKNGKYCSRKCYLDYSIKILPELQHPDQIELISFSHRGPIATRKTGSRKYWIIRCKICGTIKTMSWETVKVAQSCGCKPMVCGNKHKSWQGVGNLSGEFFNRLKRNAIKRGIIFDLTKEFLWDLYEKQNGKCALTGLNISLADKSPEKDNLSCTASVDRIDSEKGYQEDNIQWVHQDLNFMKQRFKQDHFINMCKLVVEHQGVK
jgi:hypothetical protein